MTDMSDKNLPVKDKLDNFFQQFKSQKYRKNEILIRADDEPTGVLYLTDGIVRVYSISMAGEELSVNVFQPTSFFPVSWAINDTISHYYYEAMTPVEVYKAPREAFLKFIKENNDVMLDLLSRIYRGLDGYMQRMEYLMAGNAQSRLIVELLIFAKRFGKQENGKTIIKIKLTEKDLASQSGIARETVSRELQKLRKLNLIDFDGNNLIINDLKKLEMELINS